MLVCVATVILHYIRVLHANNTVYSAPSATRLFQAHLFLLSRRNRLLVAALAARCHCPRALWILLQSERKTHPSTFCLPWQRVHPTLTSYGFAMTVHWAPFRSFWTTVTLNAPTGCTICPKCTCHFCPYVWTFCSDPLSSQLHWR